MKKSRFSKILAITLTAAALTAFTGTGVYAAHTVADNWTATSTTAADTLKTITVKNVDDTSNTLQVVAYQIVKGTYKDGKLTGYVLCNDNISIANMASPTAAEVTAIANQIQNNTYDLNGINMQRTAAGSSTFTADVEAGLYMVLVSGSDEVVYNPAIVAVNVTNANLLSSATGGEVDMKTFFRHVNDEAYMKASSSGLKKSIEAVTGSTDVPEKASGATAAVGDTVQFKLNEMTIPYFSDDYVTASLKYEITDSLEGDSFTGVKAVPAVKVAGTPVVAAATSYTITYYETGDCSGTGDTTFDAEKTYLSYKISFVPAYIKDNGGKSVEVTYQSEIADTADMNFSENKNTATLSYSNNPTDTNSAKTKKSHTYHYTFAIGGKIDAENTDTTVKELFTNELNKVETGNTWSNEADGFLSGIKSTKPLANAVFTLYSDAAFTTQVATCTTGADGVLKFSGLDAGTYYLKETTAPETYTINENDYKIVITPTFADSGAMTSYTVDVYTKASTDNDYPAAKSNSITYTATPAVVDNGDVNYTNFTCEGSMAAIVNTKIAALPSTGGVGTIAMVIVGAAGMAFFLTMIVVLNRKKGKKTKE